MELFLARPLSEDKRKAILSSAAEAVALLGLSAPTATIAAGAGVAEGTLFTYFPTKDALYNQLYLTLKQEVAATMTTDYPVAGSLKVRWRHIWDRYIGWGAANSARRKAIRQLAVSDRIDDSFRHSGNEAFRDVYTLMDESVATGAMTKRPPAFVAAILEALAETTMDFIAREPQHHDRYRSAGFEAFWGGAFNT
jgi:AcrR family transcriptional regulator